MFLISCCLNTNMQFLPCSRGCRLSELHPRAKNPQMPHALAKHSRQLKTPLTESRRTIKTPKMISGTSLILKHLANLANGKNCKTRAWRKTPESKLRSSSPVLSANILIDTRMKSACSARQCRNQTKAGLALVLEITHPGTRI
jgi:hypothetical protein